MKLLHVTDFHANRRWFNWVTDHAAEYDLVAYSGDFLDTFGGEPLEAQVQWITDWARDLRRPLLWCSGNHDVESAAVPVSSGRWLELLPEAKPFSESGRLEQLGQSFVRVEWRGAIPNLRAGNIVLAHASPAGCFTATTKGGTDNGDLDLADAISSAAGQPWLVLSGHVHNPASWKDRCGGTTLLNPGVNERANAPNYISIDTATRKARWLRDGELADVAEL